MRNFWPAFFCFILALLLLIWGFNPDYIAAALLFLGAWFTFLLYVLLAAVAGALLLGAWIVYARIQHNMSRPVDGAYPIQRFRLRGGRTAIVNPTHMIGAAAIIDRRTGEYTEIEHPAGWDVVRDIRRDIERSNTVRAMFPGDGARKDRFGAMSQMPRLNAGTMRQLEAKATPPPRIIGQPGEPTKTPAAPVHPLSLPAAFKQSVPEKWLIGQNPDAGDLAVIQPRQSVHIGVIGATGTGKTASVGFLLVAYAIRFGWHTVILDPKGGADWRPWDRHAEWHAADYGTFADQIRAVEREHNRRSALLSDDGSASDVTELRTPPPPILIVIEEYGDLIAQLRAAKRSDADHVDAILDRLMRLSRMTDIHLLFIDQYPEHWSDQVLAGTKAKAIFQLGPNQGAKVREYKADKLPDVGRFILRGQEYDSWDVKPVVDHIRRSLPVRSGPDVVGVSYSVERSDVAGTGVDTPGRGPTNGNVNAPDERWNEVVMAWFLANPQALTGPARGISDLARAMADAEGNVKPYENYKGIAHKLYHDFRKDVRVGGQPLGVDVTTKGNGNA